MEHQCICSPDQIWFLGHDHFSMERTEEEEEDLGKKKIFFFKNSSTRGLSMRVGVGLGLGG